MSAETWAMPDGPRFRPFGPSQLRVLAAVAASIAIAGCVWRASDPPVGADEADKVHRIAAASADNPDSRFARVIIADGKVTVGEVQQWLAESDAMEHARQ